MKNWSISGAQFEERMVTDSSLVRRIGKIFLTDFMLGEILHICEEIAHQVLHACEKITQVIPLCG